MEYEELQINGSKSYLSDRLQYVELDGVIGPGADNNTDWSFITFLLQQSVRTVADIIPNKDLFPD